MPSVLKKGDVMQEIDKYRKEIDKIDDQILKLLNDRMEIVKEIGRVKQTSGSNAPKNPPGLSAFLTCSI